MTDTQEIFRCQLDRLEMLIERLESTLNNPVQKTASIPAQLDTPDFPFERFAAHVSLYISTDDIVSLLSHKNVVDALANICAKSVSVKEMRLPIRPRNTLPAVRQRFPFDIFDGKWRSWRPASLGDFEEQFERVGRNFHMEFVKYKRDNNDETRDDVFDAITINFMKLSFTKGTARNKLMGAIQLALSR
jgi:hypothetical protein